MRTQSKSGGLDIVLVFYFVLACGGFCIYLYTPKEGEGDRPASTASSPPPPPTRNKSKDRGEFSYSVQCPMATLFSGCRMLLGEMTPEPGTGQMGWGIAIQRSLPSSVHNTVFHCVHAVLVVLIAKKNRKSWPTQSSWLRSLNYLGALTSLLRSVHFSLSSLYPKKCHHAYSVLFPIGGFLWICCYLTETHHECHYCHKSGKKGVGDIF